MFYDSKCYFSLNNAVLLICRSIARRLAFKIVNRIVTGF